MIERLKWSGVVAAGVFLAVAMGLALWQYLGGADLRIPLLIGLGCGLAFFAVDLFTEHRNGRTPPDL